MAGERFVSGIAVVMYQEILTPYVAISRYIVLWSRHQHLDLQPALPLLDADRLAVGQEQVFVGAQPFLLDE